MINQVFEQLSDFSLRTMLKEIFELEKTGVLPNGEVRKLIQRISEDFHLSEKDARITTHQMLFQESGFRFAGLAKSTSKDSWNVEPMEPHPFEKQLRRCGFVGSENAVDLPFPKNNNRDPHIWESELSFWVAIQDWRPGHENALRIERMTPFFSKQEKGDTLFKSYGWSDGIGNQITNAVSGILAEHPEHVILFLPTSMEAHLK